MVLYLESVQSLSRGHSRQRRSNDIRRKNLFLSIYYGGQWKGNLLRVSRCESCQEVSVHSQLLRWVRVRGDRTGSEAFLVREIDCPTPQVSSTRVTDPCTCSKWASTMLCALEVGSWLPPYLDFVRRSLLSMMWYISTVAKRTRREYRLDCHLLSLPSLLY